MAICPARERAASHAVTTPSRPIAATARTGAWARTPPQNMESPVATPSTSTDMARATRRRQSRDRGGQDADGEREPGPDVSGRDRGAWEPVDRAERGARPAPRQPTCHVDETM